jgi:sirohydrochlorin cobaltochelatase
MAPDLVAGGDALVAAGCTAVDVVPLFLGAGGHVRKDLPALMDKLRASHPLIQLRLQPAIGEERELVEAMAQIALAAVGSAAEPRPADDTR